MHFSLMSEDSYYYYYYYFNFNTLHGTNTFNLWQSTNLFRFGCNGIPKSSPLEIHSQKIPTIQQGYSLAELILLEILSKHEQGLAIFLPQ